MTIWCDKCLPTVARHAVIRVDVKVTSLMSGKVQAKSTNLCAEHANHSTSTLAAPLSRQLSGPPTLLLTEGR